MENVITEVSKSEKCGAQTDRTDAVYEPGSIYGVVFAGQRYEDADDVRSSVFVYCRGTDSVSGDLQKRKYADCQ